MQSAHCALPSDCQRKIQPAIATFSAGEFRRQPTLSDNTANQSDAKLKPTATWLLVFTHISGHLHVFSLSFNCFLVIFNFVLIGCCNYTVLWFWLYDTQSKSTLMLR